jgi:hypothetical protein
VRMIKLILLSIIAFAVSACGDDKAASTATKEAAPAVEAPMVAASDDEYGRTVDHARDAAEFELRRSIGGLDRMIEQYTADGHASDELEAQKAKLSAKLDGLLGSG